MGVANGLYSPPFHTIRQEMVHYQVFFKEMTPSQSMLSIVHSSPQIAILFSQLANVTNMTNLPSANDTKNMFLEENSVESKHCAL